MVKVAKEQILTRKQLMRQNQMLYELIIETREVAMNLTQRYEEMKIRLVSEWETVTEILEEECGLTKEAIDKKLGDKFTKNVDKYNEIVQQRIKEMEEQAEKQAETITKQAEEYLEGQGIEIPQVTEKDLEEAAEEIKALEE